MGDQSLNSASTADAPRKWRKTPDVSSQWKEIMPLVDDRCRCIQRLWSNYRIARLRLGKRPPSGPHTRSTWEIVPAAGLVGTTGVLLSWPGSMNAPMADLTGGGAFTGTLVLIVMGLQFVSGASE